MQADVRHKQPFIVLVSERGADQVARFLRLLRRTGKTRSNRRVVVELHLDETEHDGHDVQSAKGGRMTHLWNRGGPPWVEQILCDSIRPRQVLPKI